MKKSSKIRNKFDVMDLQNMLGLSYISVCSLLRKGTIKGEKIGQRWYVDKRVMDRYLNKGNIFDKPEKVILDVINQAIKESQVENMARLEIMVKEKIAKELEANMKKNLVKTDHKNIMLSEFVSDEINKQLEKRVETIKGEFQKVLK